MRASTWSFLRVAIVMLSWIVLGRGPAMADGYFAGKTITILVGVGAGGTVDTLTRGFAQYLRAHLSGAPNIIVQNMPGGAAVVATNYLAERAKPDGLTLLFGPWDPLLQALNAPTLRALRPVRLYRRRWRHQGVVRAHGCHSRRVENARGHRQGQ